MEITQNSAVAAGLIALPQQCSTSLSCRTRILVAKNSILTSLLSLSGTMSPLDRILLSADSIDVTSTSSLMNAFYIAVDSQIFTVDSTSSTNFGCNITIRNTLQTYLYGQINQLFSPSYCTQTSHSLNRIGLTIQGSNVTLYQSSTQYLAIHAKTVSLIRGGYIGVPLAYNFSSCWNDVDVQEFSCLSTADPENVTSAHYLSNSITIIASTSITISSNTVLRSSFIMMCAPTIISSPNSMIMTDGLGCPHDSGVGAGMSPLSSSSSAGGGGGGGFGGKGGQGDSVSLGGGVYGEGYDVFSVGSGGGTLYSNNTILSMDTSGGGGIVILNVTHTLTLDGIISSGGSNGIMNYGGGSGGLVAIYAGNIAGYGLVQVFGGDGGPLGGGGGGGGRIVLQNPGSLYTTYNFKGSMNYTGGDALNDIYSSQPGFVGKMLFPYCGLGYGNIIETQTTCSKCRTGTYHDTIDNRTCSKCVNKPVNAEYITSGEIKKNCDYQCFSGYVNDNCITPFERFLASMGGLTSFVSVVVGMTCLIFPPLYILRLRRKAERLKQSSSQASLVPEIGTSNWFNPVLDQQLLDREDREKQSTHSARKSEMLVNLEVGLDHIPNPTPGEQLFFFLSLLIYLFVYSHLTHLIHR